MPTDGVYKENTPANAESASPQLSASAAGAVVGGLAALSCCVAPLIFGLLGISGAWIANLTALSPYQPVFIALATGSILYGHVVRYRAKRSCAVGAACSGALPNWMVNAGLWAGTALVAVAVAANFIAPYFL